MAQLCLAVLLLFRSLILRSNLLSIDGISENPKDYVAMAGWLATEAGWLHALEIRESSRWLRNRDKPATLPAQSSGNVPAFVEDVRLE